MALPNTPLDFARSFSALCGGRTPFRWQRRLYDRLAAGDVPKHCALPTGFGKTSVMVLWLIALASGASLPRRLIYIVNRRTVVDQASDEARALRGKLADSTDEALIALRDNLAKLSGDSNAQLLAIGTLRGELADNGEWKNNPARATIIVGTIDMIGSRLLFSGYGDRRYGRAHHAGLIGQDALIIHDEAHLSPAFDMLLAAIEEEQKRSGDARRIRITRLSATLRPQSDPPPPEAIFGVESTDEEDPLITQRFRAAKNLKIRDATKSNFINILRDEALRLGESACRVLVYVRSPDIAVKVNEALGKKLGGSAADRVRVLTGTIRGKERDELASSAFFQFFKSDPNRPQPPQSLFLISTSAGEVGADLDADHLVCDLTTLDSMAQRFGRVNRLGGKGRVAEVVLVTEKADDKEASNDTKKSDKNSKLQVAQASALTILRSIRNKGGDVSPYALRDAFAKLGPDKLHAAFSPTPAILPATDILFDNWSLTSIDGDLPGRPDVGPYLHGVAEWEPPETHIAWRADVAQLAAAFGPREGEDHRQDTGEIEEVLDAFPLRSTEQLRERADRALEHLQVLAARHPDRAVILIRRGTPRWIRLRALAPENAEKKNITSSPLAYATIILPTDIGGLSSAGTLHADAPPPEDHRALDVAEYRPVSTSTNAQARQRIIDSGEGERSLVPGKVDSTLIPLARLLLPDGGEGDAATVIEYRAPRGERREPGRAVALQSHNEAVAAAAERFASALGFDPQLIDALRTSGSLHDTGKGRDVWQRYARNLPHKPFPGGPIAKGERYLHSRALGGFRHEFASLHDAQAALPADHPERDLILHLIAAHHGHARPHFEPHHYEPLPRTLQENKDAAIQAMQRFARLQQRFGRWGLAYLESILRCADTAVSAMGVRP